MKAGIGGYIVLCILNSMKICQAIECYNKVALFSYRSRANSPENCLTCIYFMQEQRPLNQYICQVEEDTIHENFFFDIYQQHNCEALTITRGYQTSLSLENSGDWYWDNLKFLDMSGNLVNNIVPNFFYLFRNLIKLDLHNNNITSIGSNEFYPLNQLQTLNLSQNSIAVVDADSFKSLTDLLEIDLSYNKIKYIPSQLFKHQGFLDTISIHNNEIVKFECIFKNIISVSTPSLDLSVNKIESLDLQGDLKKLNISFNLLNEFSFNLSSSLESLDLSSNKIKKIGEFVMLGATHLRELNLSNNFLESMPTSSFRKQKSLESLDISNNLLSKNYYGFEDNWVSFFLNFDHLKNVFLDHNMWTCTDLKDILHILKSRYVQLAEGNEHIKSNILGIACVNVSPNNTNNSTESIAEFYPHIVNRVVSEVLKHFENNTNLEQKLLNISSKINYLNNNNASDITGSSDKNKLKAEILNIYSKIKNLESQINNIQKNYSNLNGKKPLDPESGLIENINLLLDSKFSNLSKAYQRSLLQKTEGEVAETEKLLQPYVISGNAVSGDIIQNLLLFSVLCVLLYFVYISVKRNKSKSREAINLVQA